MRKDDLQYELPANQIAQQPADRRDDVVPTLARLEKVTAVHWSE